MVPSQLIVLEQLPLTPNGKIDRKALPAPETQTLNNSALPRDALELQLLGIWETVLAIHPLGIHDNFFDLGGHSLLAIKLMSHIQQQCKVRLPVSALFQHPTIAELAQQLRQNTSSLSHHIVPMYTSGTGHPLYCLPGAMGAVMYLYPLASHLAQPFYALPTPGLDGAPTPETVTALARHHLHALQQQQPTGPYYLMGHSSGGHVAFEMAWQLEQQGETVAFLGILDTNAPDTNQINLLADYTELNWLHSIVPFFESLSGIELHCSLDTLQALPDLEAAYAYVMQAFIDKQLLFAPGTPVDELKAMVHTLRITSQGQSDYQLSGQVQCPIHLFRAEEIPLMPDGTEFEDKREFWGWGAWSRSDVVEHWVSGNHVTMMTAPYVQTLANVISTCLTTVN